MICVVIPAFNEEKTIGRVISGLFDHGYINIIVVDDGSTDDTSAIATYAGATVIRHEINCGQGAALQTGNEHAFNLGAEIVIHFDADGQFNPLDIASALKSMKEKNADVLLGSRFLDSRSKIPWTKKHILLPISRLINRLVTGVRLTDAHNGFRILSRRALEKVEITQDRMAHNSEVIKLVKEKNLTYIEHPVEVRYYEYGLGLFGGVKIILELLQGKLLK